MTAIEIRTRTLRADHLASINMVINAIGVIQNESDFYPFGGAYVITQNLTQHYKFTGKERDTETGNDYFDARYYASTTGRFMSPDWASHPEAVPYASLPDPQSLNLYAFTGNNPITRADPDGHAYADAVGSPSEPTSDDSGGGGAGPDEDSIDLPDSNPQQVQNECKDPDLPINKNYILVVESDSGVILPGTDTREVTYDLRTPDGTNLGGDPGAATFNSAHIRRVAPIPGDFTR